MQWRGQLRRVRQLWVRDNIIRVYRHRRLLVNNTEDEEIHKKVGHSRHQAEGWV